MITKRVLQKRNGMFQKTDQGSGYPYDVKHPWDAKDWSRNSDDEIAHYISMFPEYFLVEVEMNFEVTKFFHVEQKKTEIKTTVKQVGE